ncbi:hypothetical protein DM02DRAFT_636649 [Periconia macrospinosa]|uniref:Uncharacterized protein n=1 Tax=Periconia macrospinosa TaxID=97972 RepID=A0A2V1CY61_9PLEO|nr:hypothetical protein DM02DRAFT_636649 [Periconia macrospinosa]
MPTTCATKKLLLHLSPELNVMICELLGEVDLWHPEKECDECFFCQNQSKMYTRGKRWSPHVLAQLSKDHKQIWNPIMTATVCASQLSDYTEVYCVDGVYCGPKVSVHLDYTTLAGISLHVLYECSTVIPKFSLGRDFGEWNIVYCKIQDLPHLRPGTGGTGKIDDLFLDSWLGLRLYPKPGYLTSFPTVDQDLRESLQTLRNSTAVSCMYLQLFPREGEMHAHPWDERTLDRFPHRDLIQSATRMRFWNSTEYVLTISWYGIDILNNTNIVVVDEIKQGIMVFLSVLKYISEE